MKTTTLLILSSLALFHVSCAASKSAPAAQESDAATNEEITNNQEQGVDEGGIVKNIGDHLVMLRGGQLFAVDVATSGKPTQTSAMVVAQAKELNKNVWYDEMLVRGRDIYVVGFRYSTVLEDEGIFWDSTTRAGATEIAHFSLDASGKLVRQETIYFESSDYYDTSNYASRMIGGTLVFYMPLYSRYKKDDRFMPPKMLKYIGGGRFTHAAPIMSASAVKTASKKGYVLHTVVSCQVNQGQVSECAARAMRGTWASARYVTRDDVYLWEGSQKVWAFSLLDGTIKAHAVDGQVMNQFSLKYDKASHTLRALVLRHGNAISLMEIPRADFDANGTQSLEGKTHPLTMTDRPWNMKTRFVGNDHIVIASRNKETTTIFDYSIVSHTLAPLTQLSGAAYVQRIEPMGEHRALVSATNYKDKKVHMDLLALDLHPEAPEMVSGSLTLSGVAESESRSHGFFFKPKLHGGLFGLPVLGKSGRVGWWGNGASNIAFFSLTEQGKIAIEGTVSSSPESKGKCATSCVDWYGNTRPIFLRDRIFALMGAELAEVEVNDGVRVLHRLVMK